MSLETDRQWIGRREIRRDAATAAPLRALDALFDRPARALDEVPPLGHWLYFLPHTRQSELGDDGHPLLGSVLPDLGLPRRMWAGSRISFHAPIMVGDEIVRRTTLLSISRKNGASGPLAFVTLRHEVTARGALAVNEEQDLVYRAESRRGEEVAKPSEPAGELSPQAITATRRFDPIQLFRFSAITFNAHRIHYDVLYAREVEGYPKLVVHGPYQAMCLIDLWTARFPERPVARFSFRARAPLFCGEEALLAVEPGDRAAKLTVTPGRRGPTMTASLSW